MTRERRPRWLIFGVGNPSRGDDALGPSFIERLTHWSTAASDLPVDLTLLTDFQWQVEHALDIEGVDVALFVDSSLVACAPFRLERLPAKFDVTYSTHALSPACVLAVAQRLGQALPEAWLLSIPGRNFDLGAPLSAACHSFLNAALDYVREGLRAGQLRSGETVSSR